MKDTQRQTATESALPGLVRRVRRIAGMSQRELAEALGVGQSSVGRWEQGQGSLSAAVLERMAALAGLTLALVDPDGTPVRPMREDAAHDVLGRRMPAHAEAERPAWWMPRDASTSGEGLAELRRSRELGRAVAVTTRHPLLRSSDDKRHDDHPTRQELVDRLETAERELREMQEQRARERRALRRPPGH